MKKIFIALTAAALALTLCACGGNSNHSSNSSTNNSTQASTASTASAASQESAASATEGTAKLQGALDKVKAQVTFPGETADYSAKRIQRTFGITEEQMEEFAGLYCNDGVTQDQIIYIKAKSDADVKDIQDELKANLDSIYNVIKNYTPEQVEMIQKATVDTEGLYVSLVISNDAEKIKEIFNESIKG